MLNQVILIGRLVKKPELRVSEGGVNYIKATLAVQSEFKNKDGDYDTEFLEITAFGKLAENTANKVSFLSRAVKKEEKQDGDVFVLGQ